MKKLLCSALALVMMISAFSIAAYAFDDQPAPMAIESTAEATSSKIPVIICSTGGTVDYFQYVIIQAAASNMDEGYGIAVYSDGKQLGKSKCNYIKFESDFLKSDTTFQVKVIDKAGKPVKDSTGNDIEKIISIKVNGGFFKRFVAFFRTLFGGIGLKVNLSFNLSEKQYKNICDTFTYTYDDLMRNADDYVGAMISFTGYVLQAEYDRDGCVYRVATDGFWGDVILTGYENASKGKTILEDDMISVYGQCGGNYTYTAIFGNSVTVPAVLAKYITVVNN